MAEEVEEEADSEFLSALTLSEPGKYPCSKEGRDWTVLLSLQRRSRERTAGPV